MTWLRVLVLRLIGWVRRNRLDDEFDEEVRFHLEKETEANVRRGLTPEDARRAARVRLGGVERFKEEVRDARGLRLLDELGRAPFERVASRGGLSGVEGWKDFRPHPAWRCRLVEDSRLRSRFQQHLPQHQRARRRGERRSGLRR